ncbi:HigA family addiction module antitoxin [Pseudomonas fragi]|uniref:HigA family addiction module antitoxin n=1 Tax=Pseudomonas fragi TaxID=296 RepID=UPI001EED7F7D|nr:HigA family addiction module antitoxin [Pseudomonas fragi]MBM1207279.1 HigA family addiction module antidote protein [Pseudomonas fragi]
MIGMHPGEYIHEVFVEELGLSQRELAEKLGVSPSTVSRILSSDMAVSADMALKLEEAFERSAESWLKMQSIYDLKKARSARAAA